MSRGPVLLTGANGQVGNALRGVLAKSKAWLDVVVVDAVPLSGGRVVNFVDPDALVALVREVRPSVIVNTAAYTAVDKAETEEYLAHQVNAVAPGILAEESARLGARLIHYSTDYVFPGVGDAPHTEDAPTRPLNAYGRTKLAGEQAVLAADPRATVLRTSWVFSEHGQNFVKTMLRLGEEREILRVIVDQVGAPTSAGFLADMTKIVMEQPDKPGGVYHLCCGGETSWYGFAGTICELARPSVLRGIIATSTENYGAPVRRPLNSRLNCEKFCRTFNYGRPLMHWRDALIQVLGDLGIERS